MSFIAILIYLHNNYAFILMHPYNIDARTQKRMNVHM